MSLPNKLTIGRMFCIPVVIIISFISYFKTITIIESVNLQDLLLFIVFALASFTDFLDGRIARKRNIVTNFGKFMDPLADKLLVISTLIVLLEFNKFTVFNINLGFVITIIIARELAITSLRTIAADNRVVIAASKLGKLKTFSQMIMIGFLLLDCYPFTFFWGRDITAVVLISVALILTIVSGVDYFIKNRHVFYKKQGE